MDSSRLPTTWGGPIVEAPSVSAVTKAAESLAGSLVRTPLIPLGTDYENSTILLKPEALQLTGSYKLRGVLNWANSLSVDERRKGLITHSAGNTALALGNVASRFGVTARSLLPDRTPENKIEAIRRVDVAPVLMPMHDLLEYIFRAGWNDEPFSYLNPWVDDHMIVGNGTVAFEICNEMPEFDSIFIPVGGGGLLAGVGSIMKQMRPSVRVVGVQPEACPSLKVSLEAGGPTWVESQPTVCDTALPLVIDELYPILSDVIDDVVLVSESDIKRAVVRLALEKRMVVEAAGAMSVAAALSVPADERGTAVCIVSGGSIDFEKLLKFIHEFRNEDENHQ